MSSKKHTKTTCNCGKIKYGKCENCAKVKMVILLKKEYHHLKVNGVCPVRYNYQKYNKKPVLEIIAVMTKNLAPKWANMYNQIAFYDNQTGNQISKIS